MPLTEDCYHFSQKIQVANYECDMKNRLKLSDILRHIQELSGAHLDALGLTYEKLWLSGQIFLLSKIRLNLYRRPTAGEMIRLNTAPKRPIGAQFIRCSELLDDKGRVLVHADAVWMLVDPQNRRILRPKDFLAADLMTNALETAEIGKLKPAAPAPLQGAGAFTVPFSALDVNRHMNNAYYADLFCDALPTSLWEENEMESFLIHYQSEAVLGQEVQLHCAAADKSTWYVKGEKDGERCFEAQATLRRDETDGWWNQRKA